MARRARQQKNKKGLLVVGIVLAVVLLGLFVGFFVMRGAVNKVAANVIWDNIYVENVELSGMKKEEAMEALEELEKVQGISKADAVEIYKTFHGE